MAEHIKGRGAFTNRVERFQALHKSVVDDGWPGDDDSEPRSLATSVTPEQARSIITYNKSPDIGFDRSINPYRGCEHGCIYCFARPTHAYLGLSPGLDFETRLTYKADAAALLSTELARPSYRCAPLMLGANTDPYQPVERELRVTRSILEVLARTRHPVAIITKGTGVLRDLDLLADMARDQLVSVSVSMTTLSTETKRALEPRTASPAARLRVLRELSAAGVPAGVLVAPVIPAITDHEMEAILEAAAEAGARWAGYVLLRLPLEIKDLFREWLQEHFPQRAAHVLSLIQDMREGRDYNAEFGTRMRGTGAMAELLRSRFMVGCRRLHLDSTRRDVGHATHHFRPPSRDASQFRLEF